MFACALILPTHITLDVVKDKKESLETTTEVLDQHMKTRLAEEINGW